MADVLPGFSYAADSGRFRNLNTGRFVSRGDINGLLTEQVQTAESRMRDLATAFHEGRIAPASFVDLASTEIKRLALQNEALAKGGFDRLNFSDYGRAGATLRDTYQRIIGSAQDVADGKVTLPQLLNRMDSYVGEGRKLYYETQRQNAPVAPEGMTTLYRRILDAAAQHCASCVSYYDAGWQTSYVSPGDQCECKGNCRCTVTQRDVPTSELSDWIGTKR